MKRTESQRLASKLDLDLARVVRRIDYELSDSPEARAWANAQVALLSARNHVRSIMSDEDRRAGV